MCKLLDEPLYQYPWLFYCMFTNITVQFQWHHIYFWFSQHHSKAVHRNSSSLSQIVILTDLLSFSDYRLILLWNTVGQLLIDLSLTWVTECNMFPLVALNLIKLVLNVGFLRGLYLDLYYSSGLYINDFSNCSKILDIHLFADDSNLLLSDKNLINLERVIKLVKVKDLLNANKLTLNVSKSNFFIFHSHKKKVNHNLKISINDVALEQKQNTIKYLGIIIDSNLNWKNHVHQNSVKVSKCIGILSKLRYYLDRTILKQLYYAFLYLYLTYGLVAWGKHVPY